ncbi:MAG: hypothetical protein BMS9Abin26_2138 [Gammaproteobacteria bacterium]|nr:MAG: hypothetical protein BMS9Abin26_2138 [Gammaproteobacteria bacterium]
MRIIILGAPGTGKSTQTHKLVEKFAIPQISTGDLLRAAVDANSVLGRQARPYMDAGQLVPDEIVLGLISERLQTEETKDGFILDGFPRNMLQAEALDEILGSIDRTVQGVIHLNVDFDTLMQRLAGRRTCRSCGALYNTYTSPPKMDGRCDECGGKLRHRADDNEETIGNRLRVYETQTEPLIDYYHEQEKLRSVQGEGKIDTIFKAICKIVTTLPKVVPKSNKVTFADLERKVMESVASARDQDNEETQAPARDSKQAAPEKVVKKTAKKKLAKKAARKTGKKKVIRKVAKKVTKKTTRKKLAKKIVKKTAKKIVRKTARKKVAKKVAKKSSRKKITRKR